MDRPSSSATVYKARGVPWWTWIVLGSAVFVYATGSTWFTWLAPIWPRAHAVLAHIPPWLDLALENNLGVWWSGALLFVGAMLLFEAAVTSTPEARRPFAILGLLSLGLSVDEVASVHERLSERWGWSPLLAIGLVAAGLLGWALQALARRSARRTAFLVLAGYVLYASVVLQEAAEHGNVVRWLRQSARLEEGIELLGSLLILLAAAAERPGARETRLRAVILRPDRLPNVAGWLTAALVLHALVTVFVVPGLRDWEWRGNPATWYPSAVHGLAACAAFWRGQASQGGRRVAWTAVSIILLLASIGAVFDEVALFPGIDRVLPRHAYYGFYASYVFLVPALLLLALGGRLVRRPTPLLIAVALPLVLHWLTGSWRVDIVTPGLLAWAFATAFRVGESPDLP